MTRDHRKMFVFGLDGATWRVILPMIENGDLPALRYLMEKGSAGPLNSIEPAFSPSVWTTISSGKMPDKHGVDFFFSKSTMVKTARIWDILEQRGFRIGLYGHLVTWPPRSVRGFMVPDDLLAPDSQTYPPKYFFLRKMVLDSQQGKSMGFFEGLEYVSQFKEFGIRRRHLFKGLNFLIKRKLFHYRYLDRYYRKRFLKEEMQSDAFVRLMKRHKCDFSYYYCNLTDSCAHLYWKYMEPDKFKDVSIKEISKYSHVVAGAYKKADQILGKIMKHLDESVAVLVVSDHGFQAAPINHKGSTFEIRTEALAKMLDIEEAIQYSNLGARVFISVTGASGYKPADIISKIESVRLQPDDRQVFTATPDENQGNMIQVELREKEKSLKGRQVQFESKLWDYEALVLETDSRISGVHAMDGIFLAKGEGIIQNNWIEAPYQVVDVTPTILAYFGLPTAEDMDGRSMDGIFRENAIPKGSRRRIDTYDDAPGLDIETGEADIYSPDEAVRERLRALGYL